MVLKLYNTLTRKKEVFKPIKKSEVGMYSCGPTVYWYQHIGNLRTALLNDLLKRVLFYNGYKINHVTNITDVDDKTIRASRKERVSLRELTKKYEDIYLDDLDSLNVIRPTIVPRATQNIGEMINIISKLLKKGVAYVASDGVYFSIDKFPNYGKLAGLEKMQKAKAMVKGDEYDKDNLRDFALWKFPTEDDGDVFWDAPFGKGRPGWHIECSAMSIKYLGERFDIHTGATDLIFPHHTNEIAQSEACTGKKFVNYWIHGAFLNMKNEKMSKSLGNISTLRDVLEKGYDALHFRYLVLMTHYRKELAFSFESLDAARNAFERLRRKISDLRKNLYGGKDKTDEYQEMFLGAINDDLNLPRALQVFWNALDDDGFDSKKKLKLLKKFDEVLGLGIKEMREEKLKIPSDVRELIERREKMRAAKNWGEADLIRAKIREKGFEIEDSDEGIRVRKI